MTRIYQTVPVPNGRYAVIEGTEWTKTRWVRTFPTVKAARAAIKAELKRRQSTP